MAAGEFVSKECDICTSESKGTQILTRNVLSTMKKLWKLKRNKVSVTTMEVKMIVEGKIGVVCMYM